MIVSQVLEGEKGVKCYGLAKTLSDNIKYLGYEGASRQAACQIQTSNPVPAAAAPSDTQWC